MGPTTDAGARTKPRRSRAVVVQPPRARSDRLQPVAIAVAISAPIFTVMQGLTYPLLALKLQRAGVSDGQIGANAAMMPLGMVAAGPLAPRLLGRLGARRLARRSLP